MGKVIQARHMAIALCISLSGFLASCDKKEDKRKTRAQVEETPEVSYAQIQDLVKGTVAENMQLSTAGTADVLRISNLLLHQGVLGTARTSQSQGSVSFSSKQESLSELAHTARFFSPGEDSAETTFNCHDGSITSSYSLKHNSFHLFFNNCAFDTGKTRVAKTIEQASVTFNGSSQTLLGNTPNEESEVEKKNDELPTHGDTTLTLDGEDMVDIIVPIDSTIRVHESGAFYSDKLIEFSAGDDLDIGNGGVLTFDNFEQDPSFSTDIIVNGGGVVVEMHGNGETFRILPNTQIIIKSSDVHISFTSEYYLQRIEDTSAGTLHIPTAGRVVLPHGGQFKHEDGATVDIAENEFFTIPQNGGALIPNQSRFTLIDPGTYYKEGTDEHSLELIPPEDFERLEPTSIRSGTMVEIITESIAILPRARVSSYTMLSGELNIELETKTDTEEENLFEAALKIQSGAFAVYQENIINSDVTNRGMLYGFSFGYKLEETGEDENNWVTEQQLRFRPAMEDRSQPPIDHGDAPSHSAVPLGMEVLCNVKVTIKEENTDEENGKESFVDCNFPAGTEEHIVHTKDESIQEIELEQTYSARTQESSWYQFKLPADDSASERNVQVLFTDIEAAPNFIAPVFEAEVFDMYGIEVGTCDHPILLDIPQKDQSECLLVLKPGKSYKLRFSNNTVMLGDTLSPPLSYNVTVKDAQQVWELEKTLPGFFLDPELAKSAESPYEIELSKTYTLHMNSGDSTYLKFTTPHTGAYHIASSENLSQVSWSIFNSADQIWSNEQALCVENNLDTSCAIDLKSKQHQLIRLSKTGDQKTMFNLTVIEPEIPLDTEAPKLEDPSTRFTDSDAGITVSWDAATDNLTSEEDLSYKVYCANESLLDEPQIRQYGVEAGQVTGVTTLTLPQDLQYWKDLYCNVLVKDEQGNVTLYHSANRDRSAPQVLQHGEVHVLDFDEASEDISLFWPEARDRETLSLNMRYEVHASSNLDDLNSLDALMQHTAVTTLVGSANIIVKKADLGINNEDTVYITILAKDESGNGARYSILSIIPAKDSGLGVATHESLEGSEVGVTGEWFIPENNSVAAADEAFTLSFWFKITSDQLPENDLLVQEWIGEMKSSFLIKKEGEITWTLEDILNNRSPIEMTFHRSDAQEGWHHALATGTRANHSFYANGRLQGSWTIDSPSTPGAADFFLAAATSTLSDSKIDLAITSNISNVVDEANAIDDMNNFTNVDNADNFNEFDNIDNFDNVNEVGEFDNIDGFDENFDANFDAGADEFVDAGADAAPGAEEFVDADAGADAGADEFVDAGADEAPAGGAAGADEFFEPRDASQSGALRLAMIDRAEDFMMEESAIAAGNDSIDLKSWTLLEHHIFCDDSSTYCNENNLDNSSLNNELFEKVKNYSVVPTKLSTAVRIPVPGNDGFVILETKDSQSVQVQWFSAMSLSEQLSYRVLTSNTPYFTDVTSILDSTNTRSLMDWTSEASLPQEMGLLLHDVKRSDIQRYIYVLVRDEHKQIEAYQMASYLAVQGLKAYYELDYDASDFFRENDGEGDLNLFLSSPDRSFYVSSSIEDTLKFGAPYLTNNSTNEVSIAFDAKLERPLGEQILLRAMSGSHVQIQVSQVFSETASLSCYEQEQEESNGEIVWSNTGVRVIGKQQCEELAKDIQSKHGITGIFRIKREELPYTQFLSFKVLGDEIKLFHPMLLDHQWHHFSIQKAADASWKLVIDNEVTLQDDRIQHAASSLTIDRIELGTIVSGGEGTSVHLDDLWILDRPLSELERL